MFFKKLRPISGCCRWEQTTLCKPSCEKKHCILGLKLLVCLLLNFDTIYFDTTVIFFSIKLYQADK